MGTALGVALAGALFTAAAGVSRGPTADATVAQGLTVAFVALGFIAVATGLALLPNRRRSTARARRPHTPASPTPEVQS